MTPEEIERIMSLVRGRVITTNQVCEEYSEEFRKAGYYERRKIGHDIHRKLHYLKKHEYVRQIGMDPITKTVYWVAIR